MTARRSIELPANVEAEVALIASLLRDNDQAHAARLVLRPDDFYQPRNRFLYEAILACLDAGQPADLVTLVPRLQGNQAFAALGVDGLVAIMESEISASRAEAYADLVRDAADRRRMIEAARRAATIASRDGLGPGEAAALAEAEMLKDLSRRHRTNLRLAGDLVDPLVADVDAARNGDAMAGAVRTGFPDIDAKVHGLQPGSLYVVAGRPSMGKTSLATSMARKAALGPGQPVLIISLETPAAQLLHNIACAEARVDGASVRSSAADQASYDRWRQALERVRAAPIIIEDSPRMTATQIRAATRVARGRWNIGLVIVDYLQLVAPEKAHATREREVAELSAALKTTARECDVPVIALAQLNRAVEARKDRRPRLSDLRDSGSIEQDADVVMLLYRQGYYDTHEIQDGQEAEVLIAKNRNGSTGMVKLAFFPRWTAFESFAPPAPPLEPASTLVSAT